MAGNPFRRQPARDTQSSPFPEEPSKAFEDALRAAVAPADAGRRGSAVKKVRIQTPPPLSPDPASPPSSPPIRRLSNEGHAGSPPPQSPVPGLAGAAVDEDPFDRRFPEDVMAQPAEVLENTRRNSETPDAKPITADKILNPFNKTLATMEPGAQADGPGGAGDAAAAKTGGVMDVDSFTRMLMTGKSESSGGVVQSQQGQQNPDGSSTDASSASRQSLFDADNKNQTGSLSTATTDSSSDDEERGVPAPASIPKSKPPPPKPRHGKLVKERAPQTVSFSEFDNFAVSDPAADRQTSKAPSSSSAKDKDLQPTTSSIQRPTISTSEQAANSRSATESQQRAPPPLPLSRRRSQMQALSIEKPSNAPTAAGSGPASPDPLGKPSKAPAPPPTRRATGKSNVLPDQNSITSDSTSQLEQFPADPGSKRRSFNAALADSSRSSSVSERTAMPPPPPPPPRRRRGSSRSSTEVPPPALGGQQLTSNRLSAEFRRPSQDSMNMRRASGLSQVSEAGDGSKPRDLLADLSALQAEVDALHEASRRLS